VHLRRVLPWAAVLLAAAAGALFLDRGSGPPPPAPWPAPGSPAAGTAPAGQGGGPSPAGASAPPAVHGDGSGPLDQLRQALAAGDVAWARTAAAGLRRTLRTDPSARLRAAATLLDPESPPELRRALALVFGTFGGADSDAVLLAVLRDFPEDPGLLRCALLGLGGTREPEDDDEVFDLGDRPWGAKGPGGLGITVRRKLEEPVVREAAERFLRRNEPALREAAASALRHTLAEADVRRSFVVQLAVERADEVAAVLGESLAGRAGGTEDPGERREIVGALLARAGDDGLDAYRFRMEDDFERVALGPQDRAALFDLAGPARPFGVRSFALAALARSSARTGGKDAAGARASLAGLLASDGDAAVRDLSARLLAKLPFDAAAAEALARAAAKDAAWNVRFTALETLASFGKRPVVLEALDAGAADPDTRVRERAAELRRTLR
jgi:HEAT repeat protein